MIRSVIKGVGGYLPEKKLTNADLEKMVDTSDVWIRERTGIEERRIADETQLTSDLAIQAAQSALIHAGLSGSEIDMVIVATTTPDDTLPATAVKVQKAIGMTNGFAFDIQAVCSGFMFALATADNYIRTGDVKRVLVVGAETLSRIVDWSDRNTCVLFGDGAGAVVLEAQEFSGTKEDTGVLHVSLRSDGRYQHLLGATGGVSRNQKAGTITMEGKEVFRHAVTNLAAIASEVMDKVGIDPSEIDYLVPHQANIRIIDGTAKKLNFDSDHVILTLPKQGNTSSASIPLALWQGVMDGRIKRGSLLLLESMGGGFTWAGALIRF